MGDAAQRRGLPRELPVMAALVESGMTNADHGDADSLGFFQMRASVWDSGPYAGYAHKPKLQLQWFLDAAERVQHDRRSGGLPMDKDHYGEWVADVERPAAQYRGRYQLRLDDARELLRNAADGRSNGNAAEVAAGAVDSASMTAGPNALTALKAAERQLGVRYVWGGASPKTGFDCSGLMQWAYAHAGIKLPRTSEEQILAPGGRAVSRRKLLPGDLVFFRNASGDVHHVGMSLGGDKFVAAPHTGDVVSISSLKEPGYAKEFIGGRRFDGAVRASNRGANARVLPVVTP
jgi:cell wall-associated NlpC family hydrolase